MKKITAILLIGLSALFFTACSNDNDTLPVQVNMIGTWHYHISTQNSPCDGLVAQGFQTTDSLNGDMQTMGDTHIVGTNLMTDTCEIEPIDKISTLGNGFPSIMTKDEYLAYLEHFHGADSYIQSITIDLYSNAEIIMVFELADGTLMTTQLTRV
ncbi:hypothetical protein [Sulfurovum sp. NBC37-1]|uniref:hypothetical protein n=1 Tax=Sulfurovum sp. (strain NBC37-1) TaxID=387093 RepID=UPI00015875B3|nr:hypothetical protein [Sulfurovum sp. NBC37-1]BAF71832.1 hypothetical protein SUN_0874 [Sulfurovum sp. NBC37-1]